MMGLVDTGIRPVDPRTTRIGDRNERRSRRPFPDPSEPADSPEESEDDAHRPVRSPRRREAPPHSHERRIDIRVDG